MVRAGNTGLMMERSERLPKAMEPELCTNRAIPAAAAFAVVALAAIQTSAMRKPLQDAEEVYVLRTTWTWEDQTSRRTVLPSPHQLDEVIG
jgi:hypothetical protein